ncbi:amino acid adenylation domain-containing protein [Dyella sp. LX-66]|uniref:amino acid adenylation domain-containing protein n=1 Tax=unclassified Dyella TaxID=2634549 RepID=UPI001BE01FE3|nr:MULTISPECIES: amino acid adenylation domain-containing protein [unclassified Dyella]MBT2117198.1 amino acid adenylation domain-containing protein [Dyella sp. LX-1]MBT2139726.1 amino acid adenylation domain-containing protein [Dyella sp. LX-66]
MEGFSLDGAYIDVPKAPQPGLPDVSFAALFERQVDLTPHAIALVFGDARLSYGELDTRANQLAAWLSAKGVRPEDIVAIALPRSFESIVAILATHKVGAAYLPLDPDYPEQRLSYMLEEAAPACVLAFRETVLKTPPALPAYFLDDADLRAEIEALPPSHVGVPHDAKAAQRAAYVIYTSGSTGQPKGVVVTHAGIAVLVATYRERLCIEPESCVLQFASLSFDASFAEIAMALALGARLVMAPSDELLPGPNLTALCERQRITHLALPPSLLTLMTPGDLPGVETLVVGGEACPAELAVKWARTHRLVNCYGPTEATVDALISAPIGTETKTAVPIGSPVSGAAAYVLDATLRRVPQGDEGELYLAGPGLARGYLHRPGLTAASFHPDPFGAPGSRMYRTGDIARQLTDGSLCFIGRADQQVKLHGLRIELDEIEAWLRRDTSVAQAAVLMREDRTGHRQLVGYVVPKHGQQEAARDASYEAQQVAQWQVLHDGLYSQHAELADDEDFGGWDSSYDGAPIPLEEMREWRDAIVGKILDLRPQRLLEIGVGTGLILWKVAPHCAFYCGTDFSLPVIDSLKARMAGHPELRERVDLRCQPAHEIGDLPQGGFDTIVINSVVQYFPGAGYLTAVLRQCAALLAPGGRVLIGDVPDFRLMRCFATSVAWHRAGGGDARAIRHVAEEEMRLENEMLVDPGYFSALPQQIEDLAGVDIQLKRGRARNEMARYRYDVVLHKRGTRLRSAAALPILAWGRDVDTMASLRQRLLAAGSEGLRVSAIVNARLTGEFEISRRVWGGREDASAPAVDPEDLKTLGAELGYQVAATWSPDRTGQHFDAVFLPASDTHGAALDDLYLAPAIAAGSPLCHDPGAMQDHRGYVAALRERLAEHLPAFMLPGSIVVLAELPLTANGKLDRQALPAPTGAAVLRRAYEPPQGQVEQLLAELWENLLGVWQVGRSDHFFELGGNSLLAIQLASRMRDALNVDVPIRALFEAPTLSAQAEQLAHARHSTRLRLRRMQPRESAQ